MTLHEHIEAIRRAGYSKVDEALRPLTNLMNAIDYPESDYVLINGLKWDRNNLEIGDQKYFQFVEAKLAAKLVGKRLPTEKEFEALAALGSTWDDERKGRWFGYDHEKKDNSTQSIFLPALGFEDYNCDTKELNGELILVSSFGFYWSATPNSSTDGYYLTFGSTSVGPSNTDNRYFGFAARCVAE